MTRDARVPRLVLSTVLALTPAVARAGAHDGCPLMQADRAETSSPAAVSAGGQSAFAALAGAVAALEADPATDWTRVDLDSLREHLVDMDAVATGARVTSAEIPGGLRLAVAGAGRTGEALRRMVPMHAAMMQGYRGWRLAVETTAEGVVLEWTAADPGEVAHLRGLGFFGLLASGDHHARHHLALARGEAMAHG